MKGNTVRFALALPAMILIGGEGPLAAGEPETVIDRWMKVYHESATSVEMTVTGKPDVPLTLHRMPLLKYTNPVRRVQQHGAIYVWTHKERPAVIASFWSAMAEADWRRLNFEWHSLHEAPLGAEYEGERIWNTREAGLEWQALAEAASPAALRSQRLVQMRRLASSFAVEIQTQESELRLMRQPIFRYPKAARGVVDGAIFAFVMGTDPELFLLVEAQAAEDRTQQWHVGVVRFTNAPLTVRRGGRAWWSCRKFPARIGAPVRNRKFFVHLEVKRLPADPGEMGEEKRR